MDTQLTKATRQHTKDHNSRLLLRTIYDYGEISRADLARLTRLTRTTVSEAVGDLISQGLVEEVGHGQTAVGRTPILLSVVEESRQIVAINLTSSEIEGAVVNLRGGITQRINETIGGRDGSALLVQLEQCIEQLLNSVSSPLLGIGISTPGLIDVENGIVRRAVHFGWQDLPLRQYIQQRFGTPVYIANDSHTTAMAEYMFGHSQGGPNLVVIKVDQGIGAGILLGGQLFYGDGYGAGEIGHVVVEPHGRACKCGNFGCLETVANTTALLEQARTLADTNPHSLIWRFAEQQQPISLEHVVHAFRAGDPAIAELVTNSGQRLAQGVAGLVGVLNVGRIVITGQIALFGEQLRGAVQQELRQRVLPSLAQATTIDVVSQGPDTVLLGAAALLLTYELGLTRLQRNDLLADVA